LCRWDYINELRGKNQQNIDSENENSNRSSTHTNTNNNIQSKASSLSLPQVRFHTKIPSSCQSAITLRNPNLTNTTTDDNDNKEDKTIQNNNQLIVPSIDDYRIRISNTSSIDDESQNIAFNETRISDALGYLRMYQNRNRVQFNALEFNDRADLQVNKDLKYCKKIKIFSQGFN
jgi:hypothetical protein